MNKFINQDRSILLALRDLRPGAEFAVIGNTYDGIQWMGDPATLPTRQEVEARAATIVDELLAIKATEEARQQTIDADAGGMDILNRLKTANASQISTFVDNNVTTLAQARTVMKAMIMVLGMLVKRGGL